MKFRWLFSTVFTVLLISIFLPQAASATVLRNLSEEEMTLEAQNIVVGTCTSIRSEWSEDGTKIFTYVTVLPQRSLKGESGRGELVIRQLGGEVGDVGMLVEGATVFEPGEEVFLFLRKDRKNFHSILGLHQGKYTIDYDVASGRKILSRKKLRLRRRWDGRVQRRIINIESEKKDFLDEFENRIKNILQRNR